MAEQPTVVIHFKDLSTDEPLRDSIEKRCHHLAEEFHEISRCEITLEEDGAGFAAHGHVTGKNTDVATQAGASEIGPAVDRVLDKVERQLRRVHDKRIFAQRREAQRDPPKRKRP
jgi:ribosomal subunit interface protein